MQQLQQVFQRNKTEALAIFQQILSESKEFYGLLWNDSLDDSRSGLKVEEKFVEIEKDLKDIYKNETTDGVGVDVFAAHYETLQQFYDTTGQLLYEKLFTSIMFDVDQVGCFTLPPPPPQPTTIIIIIIIATN